MDEWKECKLGDVINFGNGKTRPKAEGLIPVYGGNGILGYNDKSNYEDETIIIGRVGAYCGSVYYENKPIWISDNALSAKPKENNNAKFLFYFLKNLSLNQFAEGSSHPLVTQTLLNSIDIEISPDGNEQRAIASVLSSLDDKIDLLHRENRTLEEMAETLFRQWFVEEADERWEEVELADVTEKITDGAHNSPPTTEIGMPMASVKDMNDWGINIKTCRKISEKNYQKLIKDDCRPLKNDVLIAKDGSYLKHIFVVPKDLDLVILSSIAIIRPNHKYDPVLLSIFLKLPNTKELLKNIVTGAVIPRIVLKDFKKFPIVLPPITEQNNALTVIKPLIDKCYKNQDQMRSLEKIRDTLLPRLMSGEVRVGL